ncbi:MAG: glycosyltransferase, partial [Kovacikia sp.]
LLVNMKILFLDQSGKLGGAELCLLEIAQPFQDRCLVGLLADGPFRELLEKHQIPVQVLADKAIPVQKGSNVFQGMGSFNALITPVVLATQLSNQFDLIYANTQKALVIGAIASFFSRRPLVYHLHDILSTEHFSPANLRIAVSLANRFATAVIANSCATQAAFIAAGGRQALTHVVYNGFDPGRYQNLAYRNPSLKPPLELEQKFVIGHFSRLSPWKGQHILLEALAQCPQSVVALFVGDALFGETEYVTQLHQQVEALGLGDRVHFLGFRSDVPQLMSQCHLIIHTSTAPEPFGRVIVEAMLCGVPVIAAAAGGAAELVEPGETGWLVPPGDAQKLAELIHHCYAHPEQSAAIAHQAQQVASKRFHLSSTNQQIANILALIDSK